MILSIATLKKTVAAAAAASILALMVLCQTSTQAMIPAGEDGAALFKSKCAMCHAPDGSGSTAVGKSMKIRDLRAADVQGQTDDDLYAVVATGKNKMPGYEKTLGADSCKALVAYIRILKQ